MRGGGKYPGRGLLRRGDDVTTRAVVADARRRGITNRAQRLGGARPKDRYLDGPPLEQE